MGLKTRHPGRRIALVGLGKQGRKLADALASLGYAIVGGSDLRPAALRRFAAKHLGVLVTRRIAELARVEPEAVVVATLANSHLAVIRALDEIGCRKIFCEKPVVSSMAHLHDLLDLVVKSGLDVTVNHANLWHPDYAEVKERIREVRLGKLRSASCHFKANGFGNNGCHFVATALQLLETRIASVESAWFSERNPKRRGRDDEDHDGRASFRLENGCLLELDNLPTLAPRTWRTVFEFDRGRIELLPQRSTFVVWDGVRGRVVETPFRLQGFGLKKTPATAHALLERSMQTLLEGRPDASLSLACQAVEAVIAAHHCFVEGDPISLPLGRDRESLFGFS